MLGKHLLELQQTYTRRAGWYDEVVSTSTLGLEQRLRHKLIAHMDLRPGDTVLDLACGTGLNFEALESFIGPEGRIIGIDYTEAMMARARAKVEQHGWRNVELRQGDVTQLHLEETAHAALCTFAIGLMPDPHALLTRMLDAVRPGGSLFIADGRLSARWYGPLLNPLLQLIGLPWLPPYSRPAYWHVRPWEDLKDLLGVLSYEELLGGTVYVAWGRKHL